MIGFYNITTKIKQSLEANEITNSVTEGDLFSLDISKQSIFPLAHLAIGNVTYNGPVLSYAVTIVFADVVDISKEEDSDAFTGNDNEHDVLNTQLAAGVRLVELARRGELFDEGLQLEGSPSFEPFTERFENYLAGWVLTMTIVQRNPMTIC